MENNSVDFSRSIYCVSGSNLAFETRDIMWAYVKKKLGVEDEALLKFSAHAGEFQSGADVITFSFNGREVKVLCRRVVTPENLEIAIQSGW